MACFKGTELWKIGVQIEMQDKGEEIVRINGSYRMDDESLLRMDIDLCYLFCKHVCIQLSRDQRTDVPAISCPVLS